MTDTTTKTATNTTAVNPGLLNKRQSEEIGKLKSLMEKKKLGILSRHLLQILMMKYPVAYQGLLTENINKG